VRIFRRGRTGLEVFGGPADGARFVPPPDECACLLYWHRGRLTHVPPGVGALAGPAQYEVHEEPDGSGAHYVYCPDGVWRDQDAPDPM
jgi:hypothetical protein